MRPVFPQPGYTEADIHALLASKRFVYVDCFTIVSTDGHTLRYSTAQKNVDVFPIDDPDAIVPVTFTSKEVKISGLKTVIGVGVEVDEQEMKLDYSATQEYQGQAFSTAILRGRFDGANIRRDRYFCAKWGAPLIGGTTMFIGKTSTADSVGRSSATIKVKSDLVLLSMNMPRKLFQPMCNWTVFDLNCGLNRDDYTQYGITAGGSTSSLIIPTGITGTGNFVNGVIHIEDADAVIEVRTIKDVVGGNFVLAYPLDFEPGSGVHFSCYPGCNRTYGRCGEYGNQARYQAFEFVPKAETAY